MEPEPTPSSSQDPAAAPGDPALPQAQERTRRRSGCAKALAIAAVGFFGLLIIGGILVYLNSGSVVTWLEFLTVRSKMEAAQTDPAVREAVEKVLAEHDGSRRAAGLGPSQWWSAARSFERSPAYTVLVLLAAAGSIERVQSLKPEEVQRARAVLVRMARGIAEGTIVPEEFTLLVEKSREAQANGPPKEAGQPEAKARDAEDLDAKGFQRFCASAEELLAGRKVPEGPFEPDLPAMIGRDLKESLRAK